MYWIAYVISHYGHLHYLEAIPVLFLLVGYLSLYPAIFSVLCGFLSRGKVPYIIIPSVWVLLEWIRGKLITGFPWNLLGYSQGNLKWILQTSDLWGVYGVSWIVMLANVNLTLMLSPKGRKKITDWVILIGLLIFCFVYGKSRINIYSYSPKNIPDNKITVVLVQGNIDQSQKWDTKFRKATIKRYFELTKQGIMRFPDASLIIWPETAMPFFFGTDKEPTMKVIKFAKNQGVSIFFGSPGLYVDKHGGVNGFLNKAYLIGKDGKIRGQYAKEHLVPFGEYVPLKKILFFVKRIVPATGDFVPGKTSGIIDFNGTKIGCLICYEAIFPELARERVMKGANIIVNISNDAWFGQTAAPFQHLEMARWRAVEVRRPFLRCTNTGITAIFDPSGTPVSSLSLFKTGFVGGYVVPLNNITFYARYGDVFVIFCALTVFLKLVYVLRELKKSREGLLI